jgi:hypothetical protein
MYHKNAEMELENTPKRLPFGIENHGQIPTRPETYMDTDSALISLKEKIAKNFIVHQVPKEAEPPKKSKEELKKESIDRFSSRKDQEAEGERDACKICMENKACVLPFPWTPNLLHLLCYKKHCGIDEVELCHVQS